MVCFPFVSFFFCRPRVSSRDREPNTYPRNGLIPLVPQGLKISLVANRYLYDPSTGRCVTSSLSHFTVTHLRRRVIRALRRPKNKVLPTFVMRRPVRSGGGRIYEKKDGITGTSTSTKKKLRSNSRNFYFTDGLGCCTKIPGSSS